MCKHGVGEDPADPGEGGEHLEKIAREDIVREAADECHQKELVAREATFSAPFFLVERPDEKNALKFFSRSY